MTPQDKQKECERICRPHYSKESGLHSIAPVMCPIQADLWKNPKRKNTYGMNPKKEEA
jgi:hypothetical protein